MPKLVHRVTDLTATLNKGQTKALEAKLAAFETKKGSQIAVLVLPTTQPEDIADFSLRVAKTWKIGRENINDGVILVVAKKDRTLRLEVGRGLEQVIPDAMAQSILANTIKPLFKGNDFVGGIDAGVMQLMELIEAADLSKINAKTESTPIQPPESVMPKEIAKTDTLIPKTTPPTYYPKLIIPKEESLIDEVMHGISEIVMDIFTLLGWGFIGFFGVLLYLIFGRSHHRQRIVDNLDSSGNDSDSTNSGEPVYEMLWRCNFCGTDKLLGKTQRFCPNCGAPQEPKNRYFPNEENRVAVENYNYQGIDKTCAACSTANAANSSFCSQCGSAMDGTKSVDLKVDSVNNAPEQPAPPKKYPLWLEKYPLWLALLIFAMTTPPKKYPLWLTLLIFAMLANLTFSVVDDFWRETVNLELVLDEWQREIKIEQFQTVRDSAWCDTMPSDAYAVSRKSEVRSYKKVTDGQICSTESVDRGDGTFTTKKQCKTKYRDEPVYGDQCYFTINRWQYTRSLNAKGSDKQPKDPVLVLSKTGNCLGCERDAAHIAKYVLTLIDKTKKENEPTVCEVAENIWQQAVPQSKWQMAVSVMSHASHCDTLMLVK